MTTLFIIDDRECVQQALVQRLGRVPGIHVVGCAATSHEGLIQIRALHPDVVLLEPKLADGHGLDVLPAIRADHPATRVIVLTSYVDDFELEQAMRLGAERYLLKDIDSQRLVDVILGLNGAQQGQPTREVESPTPAESFEKPERVMLPDGEVIAIRPIRPDDAPRLQAFHVRLSPETIHMRFLGYHRSLSDTEAKYFTSVDYQMRMALVATCEQDGEERLLGVARYDVIDAAHADVAEAAIVVEDRYQRKGLGTLLADRLATYATLHGVRAFVAEVSVENDRMLRFIERTGLPLEKTLAPGVWEIKMKLADATLRAECLRRSL